MFTITNLLVTYIKIYFTCWEAEEYWVIGVAVGDGVADIVVSERCDCDL